MTLPPPLDLVILQRDGIPKPRWIAEPYVAEGDLIIIVADGGTGKTFLALDMALGLAQGESVLARKPPRQYRVLYIDEDSSIPQISRRALALAAGRGIEMAALEDRFAVYTGVGFRLDSPEGRGMMNEAFTRHRPEVVVLDVFRAFHGYEEKNAEMAVLLRHVLRPACNQHGITIILLHHTNKENEEIALHRREARNAARATRGGTEIRNAVDGLIYLERRQGTPTIYLDKTRWTEDADRPDPLAFRIRTIDEYGAIRLEMTAWEQQPKMTQAQREIEAAMPAEGEIATAVLCNMLAGLTDGMYGRSTTLRALEALEAANVIEHRKAGKVALWKRQNHEPAQTE